MPIVNCKDREFEGIMQIANLMVVSARTAPKSGGVDDIYTAIVYGDEKEHIASEMERLAGVLNRKAYKRDAGNIRKSDVIVLIGVR